MEVETPSQDCNELEAQGWNYYMDEEVYTLQEIDKQLHPYGLTLLYVVLDDGFSTPTYMFKVSPIGEVTSEPSEAPGDARQVTRVTGSQIQCQGETLVTVSEEAQHVPQFGFQALVTRDQ